MKLDLDALRVETFEAERTPRLRGTVQGHATTGGGGTLECANQCVGIPTGFGCGSDFGCESDFGDFGCATGFGCASEIGCASDLSGCGTA